MSSPSPRFVIVPHEQRPRWRRFLWAGLWLFSLVAVAWGSVYIAAPRVVALGDELGEVEHERDSLRDELEQARQDVVNFKRSDQVSRDAMTELQNTLSEREEEIAALRADVAFYERLVGGEGQRKGLTIHAAEFERAASGDTRFAITLTQNLKKTGTMKGDLTFAIEGSQDGALKTLDWASLRQQADAAPAAFEFRYFEKVQGSVMLPNGFTPHRVRVQVLREGDRVERVIPWEDTQKSEGV